MIRERMKIVPLGAPEPREKSRFKAGLMWALGHGPRPSPKSRRIEGECIGLASAVIANPASSDADLRAAFLRVATALEGEMLQGIALERRVRELEAEVTRLRKGDA